jgi:hypothetical protein
MIIKLTESQYDDILNDPLLDDNNEFSFDTLKTMDWENYQELDAYCQSCGLQRIGSGFGRIVYALDDRMVLKIGKGGRDQNDAEVFAYRNMSEDLKDFVPVIFDYDKSNMKPLWIISEQVLPASYADFQKLLGIDFGSYQSQQDIKDMNNDLKTYEKYPGKKTNESINLMAFLEDYGEGDLSLYTYELKHNEWLGKLVKMLNHGFVSYYELENIENWGLVHRNGKTSIVILDTGM